MDTPLWKTRGSYQTRRAGGVDYYVKEDAGTHRAAAFAYAGDMLLLATKEELIAGALELMARQPRPQLASESWFQDAVRAAQPGPNDVRLVYNLTRLLATPQFRSYWIQRNANALREFSAGLSDLERARAEFRERRVMLRVNPAAAIQEESAAGRVLAAIPDDAGFYRARLRPAGDEAAQWIEQDVFKAGIAAGPASKLAPRAGVTADEGTEQDLETRIDEPPLTDDRESRAFAQLRERLSGVRLEAMLEVASTRRGDVFVAPQSAIALLARDAWDANAIRAAMTQAAGSLWSTGNIGAGWRGSELDGLGKIAMAVEGPWLVIGDSADLVNAIFSRRARPAAAGAIYAAGWRHARELPNFEAMFRLMDFPQIPPAADPALPREPMFFSENIASLGTVLRRVQSAEIAVHDAGSMLRETVVYRMAP
jgi:hypothetical protein